MPENFAQILFYMNGLIFVGMIYYAFTCIFKPSMKKGWVLLVFIAYSFISYQIFFIFDNPVLNLAFGVIAFIVLTFLFSGNLSIRLVFALVMYIMSILTEGVAFLSLSYIYYIQYGTEMPLEFILSVGRTLANVIFLPLLLINILIFRKFINKRAGYKHFKIPARYTTVVLMILTGILLVNILFMLIAVAQAQINITQIIVAQFIVLTIIFLIIWLYNALLGYFEALEENRLKDQMLERWEIQYRDAMSSQRALVEVKHNWRYHFLTLAGFLKEGDIKKAESYIADKVGDFDHIITTGNISIDTMLNYYQQRIKETLDIDFETELLGISPNMKLDAIPIVMILGNALENAMEACMYVAQPERYIHLKAVITVQNELMIIITNPYTIAPVTDKEGNLLTTKTDKGNHGLGLASVKEALPEESGDIHIEYDDNVFRFMLLLYGVRRKKP